MKKTKKEEFFSSRSKKSQAQAVALVTKWRKRLNLEEWNINVSFPKEDRPSARGGTGMVTAECDADPVYLRANILLRPIWFKHNAYTREQAVIHELAHCLTQPALDMLRRAHEGNGYHPGTIADTIETLTERIANVVQWRDR